VLLLVVVWNIIGVIVLDYDRSIRHFFIGDNDYTGCGSGGVGDDDDDDDDFGYDDDDPCLGTKF
jgi:hypothetical protein